MRRSPKGRGSVYADGDGWRAQLRVNGKTHRRRARTEDEAYDLLDRLRADYAAGLDLDRSTYTVGQLLEDWLRHGEHVLRWEPATLRGYESHVRHRITPELGRVAVTKLRARHVQRFLDAMAPEVTPTTMRNVRATLRAALSYAIDPLEVIRDNPAAHARLPEMRRRVPVPLSLEQAETFVARMGEERLGAAFLVAALLGLRQSEVVGLRWEDVDFAAGTLHVRRKSYRVKGRGYYTGDPKSREPRRRLGMPAVVAEILKVHRERQREERETVPWAWSDPGLVFADTHGRPVRGEWLRRRLRDYLEAWGLPDQTFHDLRHTAASILLALGATMQEVQAVLGHSDYQVTANVYAHLMPGALGETTARIDRFLRPRSSVDRAGDS